MPFSSLPAGGGITQGLIQEKSVATSSADDKEESGDLLSDFEGGPSNRNSDTDTGCSVPKISKIVFNFKK